MAIFMKGISFSRSVLVTASSLAAFYYSGYSGVSHVTVDLTIKLEHNMDVFVYL